MSTTAHTTAHTQLPKTVRMQAECRCLRMSPRLLTRCGPGTAQGGRHGSNACIHKVSEARVSCGCVDQRSRRFLGLLARDFARTGSVWSRSPSVSTESRSLHGS